MKQYHQSVTNKGRLPAGCTYRFFYFPLAVFLIILAHLSATAQTRTVGVISATADTASGYTLFAPLMGTETYLVDNFGRKINSWKSDKMSGASDYLLEDGSLLRCESIQNTSFNGGGSGGRVKRTAWDGKVMWTYDYSSATHVQQHDIEYLPNGNILLLAWESKTQAEASARGRTATGTVWMDHIVEVKPSGTNAGEIVWEWHVWDHLVQEKDQTKENYGVIADHPELIDVNYKNSDGGSMGGSAADWIHSNTVKYNPELDQILISAHGFSEVWIIDHSTTKAEAASHKGGKHGKGGDLLYRFGNPAAYKGGTTSDRVLYLQHDPNWIAKGLKGAGNIIVFNNGTQSRGSSVDEFKLPVDADGKYDLKKAPEKVWSYAPSGFYATNLGSAQRLPNGNTLLCQGTTGTFYEVNAGKTVVWKYVSPVTSSGITQQGKTPGGGVGMQPNQCFRACKYALDFAGFKGKTITPSAAPVEGGSLVTIAPPVAVSYLVNGRASKGFSLSSITNQLHPASNTAINFNIPQNSDVVVKIFNADGREISTLVNQYMSAGDYSYTWNSTGCASGIYFVKLFAKDNIAITNKMAVLR